MNLTDNSLKRINDFQFSLQDQIGKGFSSKVYKGFHISSKEVVAIKAINSKSLKTQVQKQLLNNQIKALRSINHENIVHLNQIYQTTNNIYIITEFCKTDLSQEIFKKKSFSQKDALNVIKEVSKALLYLKKHKIVHRDVKSSNILLNQKDQIKLADFGFCQFQGEEKESKQFYNVGSPLYMSPQAYKKSIYSHKSDMWALGVVFLQLLKGKNPFQGLAYDQMIKNVMTGQAYSNLTIGGFSKMILSRLLSVDLERRMNAEEFLKTCEQQLSCKIVDNQRPKSRQNIKNITMTPQLHRHYYDFSRQKNRQNSLLSKKILISEPHNQNICQKINSISKQIKNRTFSPLKVNTNRPLASQISNIGRGISTITQNDQQSILYQSPFVQNKKLELSQTPKLNKVDLSQKNFNEILKQTIKKKMKLLNKLLLDEQLQANVNEDYNLKECKQKLCVLLYITSQQDLQKLNNCSFNSLESINMKSILDKHKAAILSYRIQYQSDKYLTFMIRNIQQQRNTNVQAVEHLIQFNSLVTLQFYSRLFQFKYGFNDLQQNNQTFEDFGKQYKILEKFYIIQSLISLLNVNQSVLFKTQEPIAYARYVKIIQQAKELLTKLI